jgi:hypothetical protein
MESNKDIYQNLLEPLFKELKVEDDTSHNLHALEEIWKKTTTICNYILVAKYICY